MKTRVNNKTLIPPHLLENNPEFAIAFILCESAFGTSIKEGEKNEFHKKFRTTMLCVT